MDHLLRRIDELIDLGEVRQQLKSHYSTMALDSTMALAQSWARTV